MQRAMIRPWRMAWASESGHVITASRGGSPRAGDRDRDSGVDDSG